MSIYLRMPKNGKSVVLNGEKLRKSVVLRMLKIGKSVYFCRVKLRKSVINTPIR